MTIKKRGHIYHYDFVYEGKRYRGSTGETERTKAHSFETHLKSTVMKGKTARGILRVAKKECMGLDYNEGFPIDADKMVEFYCKNSPQSGDTKRNMLRHFKLFQEYCEQKKINNFMDIERKEALGFIDFLKSKNDSPYMRQRALTYVSALGNQLHKYGYVETNQFANLPKEKHTTTSYDAYTMEELELIEAKATGFLYVLYCVAIHTGLRKCDIINLKKEDVNLEENFIKVKTQKTGSVVILPMLPKLRKLVEEHMAGNGVYLFPELRAVPKSKVSVEFTAFLEEIGITHTKNGKCVKGIHSFRHTFVYLAAKSGIPINIVQAIVGHSNSAMTMHYSQHASLEDTKKSLTKLPSFLTLGNGSPREELKQMISTLDMPQEDKSKMLTLLSQI